MSNSNAARNNTHHLISVAEHLINMYKTLTDYKSDETAEDLITRKFRNLNDTLTGTLRTDLNERVKSVFDDILLTIIDTFNYEGIEHRSAFGLKTSVQAAFNSTVDFAISTESRLLLNKKQDLLSDIHTQLNNAITTELLIHKLVPTYDFRNVFTLGKVINRLQATGTTDVDSYPMNVRSVFEDSQMIQFAEVLQRISEQLDIPLALIPELLRQKKERNADKHHDKRVQEHINSQQGRSRQFQTFVKNQGLLRAFDENEMRHSQKMYEHYCRYGAVHWRRRYAMRSKTDSHSI